MVYRTSCLYGLLNPSHSGQVRGVNQFIFFISLFSKHRKKPEKAKSVESARNFTVNNRERSNERLHGVWPVKPKLVSIRTLPFCRRRFPLGQHIKSTLRNALLTCPLRVRVRGSARFRTISFFVGDERLAADERRRKTLKFDDRDRMVRSGDRLPDRRRRRQRDRIGPCPAGVRGVRSTVRGARTTGGFPAPSLAVRPPPSEPSRLQPPPPPLLSSAVCRRRHRDGHVIAM